MQEFNKGVYDYIIASDESAGQSEQDSEDENNELATEFGHEDEEQEDEDECKFPHIAHTHLLNRLQSLRRSVSSPLLQLRLPSFSKSGNARRRRPTKTTAASPRNGKRRQSTHATRSTASRGA